MPRVRSIISLKDQHGFSVVEILLAATVFGFLVTGLVGALVYGRSGTASAGDRQRAVMLAEEGIEATRNIGGAAYANLTDGTYGLLQGSGVWNLSGSSDTTDIYTRQVTISTVDANRKAVTSTVSWTVGGVTRNVTLTSRLTNWLAAFTTTNTSWNNAILAGSSNLSGSTDGLKVATAGNYAFLLQNTNKNGNFVVIDISNPSSPSVVNTSTFSGTPTNIFVSGNYAYVTTNSASTALEIIDISSPTAPSLVKSVSLSGSVGANGVYVSGGYAYVVRPASTTKNVAEFNIVNVTVPSAATVTGSYDINVTMNEVYVSGNYAYVATSSTTQEMLVMNVTLPTSPSLAATFNPPSAVAATTIAGTGSTVYLGTGTTLSAVDITLPTSPAQIGTYTVGGVINDIDIDATDKLAFLGTSNVSGELEIVNINTPATMTQTRVVDIGGSGNDLHGVSYDTSLDVAVGASISNNQELITFTKN